MAKAQVVSGRGNVLHFLAWFTGVVVSLVVGYAMIVHTLWLPAWLGGGTQIGDAVTTVVGWIVVITTLISAVMVVIRK